MFDNDLITAIRTAMIAGEANAGIPNTPIKQAFQPVQQGANNAPTAYLHIVGHQRVGSVQRSDEWSLLLGRMVHTETQQYATTIQFSILAAQNPTTPNAKTAGDIANLMAYILQNEKTIETLRENDIGIQRILDVRNPPFTDDRGQNEFSPNFDSIFTHKQVIVSETPILETTEFQVISV